MIKFTIRKGRKSAYLFKTRVDSTSEAQVLRFITENLRRYKYNDPKREKFLIVTPNPEQILLALKDDLFRKIINSSTFSLPDGLGIIQAVKFLQLKDFKNDFFQPILLVFQGLRVGLAVWFNRSWLEEDIRLIHGRIMLETICRHANKYKWRVAFLGGVVDKTEVAKAAAEKLRQNYKGAKFFGFTGPVFNQEGCPIDEFSEAVNKNVILEINKFKPDILFVGMTPPKQEKWLFKNLPKLEIGGGMVAGGAFDYLAGQVKIPPKWVMHSELEWLFRLFTQKARLRRVLAAFPVFPLKVFLYKLRN